MKKEFQNPEVYPEFADLEKAVFLNQEIWRSRNRFSSISSSVELPQRLVVPTFDLIDSKFGRFMSEFHLRQKPLVGYSTLPEVPFDFDSPYYFPNIGKLRPLKLFDEFGTEWLSNVAFGKHPVENNYYLKHVLNRIRVKGKKTIEDLLLSTILDGVKQKTFSTSDITEIFGRVLISGDASFLRDVMVSFSQSESYKEITLPVSDNDLIEELGNMLAGLKKRPFYKPSMFIAKTLVQLMGGSIGQTFIPGMINISGRGLSRHVLAHEYIHSLGYHEESWSGVPINSYRTIK